MWKAPIDETRPYVPNPDYVQQLLDNAIKSGDCLLCMLTPAQPYAHIKNCGMAHRYIWIAKRGSIPKGMLICHSCDTPRCINVDHLFIGTYQDNMDDKVRKGRQHRGGPGRLLNQEQIAKARTLYDSGMTYEYVGREFSVSRRTIARSFEREASNG